MRMIDADLLMEKFKDGDSDTPEEKNFNQVARYFIRHAPTITQPNEWISVEDRLPGVTGKYIACVKDNMGARWTICADWSVEMKSWFGEFGEIKNKVTHWMPLPAPPESRPPEGEA